MSKAVVYSQTGVKQPAELTLDKAIFDLEPNHELINQAYRAYLGNRRGANAKTLTRAEVRGGGKKPWRQKGTGRARVGSSRVPNWRSGGVVFGNTGQENYHLNLSVKTKRTAIAQALALKFQAKQLVVMDNFTVKEPKTKAAAQLLAKVGSGRMLLVVEAKTPVIDQATRNLADCKTVAAGYLNVFDLMNADSVIITKPALNAVSKWLGTKTEAKPEAANV